MLKEEDELVLAQLDVSKNDIPTVNMNKLPLMFMFKHGDNAHPIQYKGEANEEQILRFLENETGRILFERKIPSDVEEQIKQMGQKEEEL